MVIFFHNHFGSRLDLKRARAQTTPNSCLNNLPWEHGLCILVSTLLGPRHLPWQECLAFHIHCSTKQNLNSILWAYFLSHILVWCFLRRVFELWIWISYFLQLEFDRPLWWFSATRDTLKVLRRSTGQFSGAGPFTLIRERLSVQRWRKQLTKTARSFGCISPCV